MNFAQIAKELREETGLSQQRLGEKLGISSSGIGHLEIGDCEPKSSTLIAYAKYFDISADYLLGLEDNSGARTTAPVHDGLSAEEREIIKKYRELNTHGKNAVKTVVDTYLATLAENKQKKNNI